MNRLNDVRPALIILLVAAAGLSIGLQGWKSRIPTWDLLPNIWDAGELIRDGRIPVKGTISSFSSFIPPGTTWLMAPGLLLSKDPRTFEYAASVALHFLTLWGIFMLARRAFGPTAAYIAAVLYGFSQIGLFYGTSLWPRGHPCFYVWMVYWLQRWVTEKRPWALAIAIAIWSTGLYHSMEIAPAILLIPVLWYVYRPPIRATSLIVAMTGCVLVWLPYLSFESTRDFKDLRALLARQPVYVNHFPDGYRQAWCNPDLRFADGEPIDELPKAPVIVHRGPISAIARTASRGLYIWRVVVSNAAGNFDLLPGIVGAKFALLLCFGFALVALSMTSTRIRNLVIRWPDLLQRWLAWTLSAVFLSAASFASVLARFGSDGVMEQVSLRWLQITLVVFAIILLGRSAIRTGLVRLAASVSNRPSELAGAPAFIAVALAIPWIALCWITEPDRADRFWWLWPLQVIVLAWVVNAMSSQWKTSSAVRLFPAMSLVLVVCATEANANRVRGWAKDGWSGVDADEVRVVDFIGHRLRGRTSAKIGYQIYFAHWMPKYHSVDMRFRVGAETDVLFESVYGVRNTGRCGEGIDPDDDYRIVEADPPGGMRSTRFELPADRRFALVQEIGRFKVLTRAGVLPAS